MIMKECVQILMEHNMRYIVYYNGHAIDLYYNKDINWMLTPERATIFEDYKEAKKYLDWINKKYPHNAKSTDIIEVEE